MEPVFSSSLTDRLENLEVSVSDPSAIEYRIFEGQNQLRVLKQGVATVTMYSAWSATKSIKLKKQPQTIRIKTLTKVSTGFTAKFIQRTYVGGYQIRYSKDPTYKTRKTASRTGAANTTITRKGLAKGTWYVSVRTFNIAANGTKYYSAWSSSKKIVVK